MLFNLFIGALNLAQFVKECEQVVKTLIFPLVLPPSVPIKIRQHWWRLGDGGPAQPAAAEISGPYRYSCETESKAFVKSNAHTHIFFPCLTVSLIT